MIFRRKHVLFLVERCEHTDIEQNINKYFFFTFYQSDVYQYLASFYIKITFCFSLKNLLEFLQKGDTTRGLVCVIFFKPVYLTQLNTILHKQKNENSFAKHK